ncbi:MAG: ATP-binding cassette domain-containing protein [Spirochaetota bacterium]|nr:ATP-binding cassette domain-containing protein [Spirochaetota bacterium]
MMHNTSLYKIEDLKHGYNDIFRLDISKLTIDKGSSIGFVGANGSGKTTLLMILAFLEDPIEGNIYFEGIKVNSNKASFRNNVTLLPQDPYLLKRTVFDNVAYGLRMLKQRVDIRERVYEALEWVGLSPEIFAKRRWFELSGGEAQRVALSSRLVIRPKVLLLDEPTSNIDQSSATLIKEAIFMIRNMNETTLIISSHDHLWLNRVTEEIFKIHNGRLVGSGLENIIEGTWNPDVDGLWSMILGDGKKIYSTKPTRLDSVALLNPSDIIISDVMQSRISAQNNLKGRITSMSAAKEFGKIEVNVETHGIQLVCNLTQHAVYDLKLLPGKDVWIIFKASSLNWQ